MDCQIKNNQNKALSSDKPAKPTNLSNSHAMSQSNARILNDTTPSPLAVLVIILMVVLIHAFAIIIAISAQPAPKMPVNVLEAQILSAADAKRMSTQNQARMSTQITQKNPTNNAVVRPKFQERRPQPSSSSPVFQSSSESSFGSDESFYHDFDNPSYSDIEKQAQSQDSTLTEQTEQENSAKPSVSSDDIKKAKTSAASRVIAAWQNHDDVGGKALTVTITLDDAGNVTNVRIGKGDQELAQSATAAIYDSAPFSELAGISKSLTIQFVSKLQ